VKRDALPELTVDHAGEILKAAESYLGSKMPAPEPTKFDRIRERALAHAETCSGCVRRAGIAAGDVERVTGLGWRQRPSCLWTKSAASIQSPAQTAGATPPLWTG
jgi:hypothetical protein